MFYSLNGTLIYKDSLIAVIECAGVGYKCLTSLNTQKELPTVGSKVMLYTHLNVREDAVDLFGFIDQNELNCFKMLTSVSGVGAKVGLAILSELSYEQIGMAIASGDSKTLTKAAGVGNKLAQRIILELKDKLKNISSASGNISAANMVLSDEKCQKAIDALSVLGYSPSDIAPVVAGLDKTLSVEELIRLSLKSMAGRR